MAVKPSIITRDVSKLSKDTGNVYKSISVISKRSRQIATEVKKELGGKLDEFASTVDNLEEIIENREQIEISKFYERMPKATAVATSEFVDGKVLHRDPESDQGGIEI